MPRRREVPKREILPDPKFGNVELSKFMNVIMEGGKKAVAERIIYGALDFIEKKNPGKDPVEAFTMAINNVKPMVEVKSRRVGGANYQVPVEVRPVRRLALSMRWIKEAARKRSEKSMAQRLANELVEATEGRGGAMKKRDEVHRMAEANKAFSHFRFRFTRASCAPASLSEASPRAPKGSRALVLNFGEFSWHAIRPLSVTATSVSRPTSTPARPPPPNVSCTTPV